MVKRKGNCHWKPQWFFPRERELCEETSVFVDLQLENPSMVRRALAKFEEFMEYLEGSLLSGIG